MKAVNCALARQIKMCGMLLCCACRSTLGWNAGKKNTEHGDETYSNIVQLMCEETKTHLSVKTETKTFVL